MNVYVRGFQKTLDPVNVTEAAEDEELKIYNVVGGWKRTSISKRIPAWAVTKIKGGKMQDTIDQVELVCFIHHVKAVLLNHRTCVLGRTSP